MIWVLCFFSGALIWGLIIEPPDSSNLATELRQFLILCVIAIGVWLPQETTKPESGERKVTNE